MTHRVHCLLVCVLGLVLGGCLAPPAVLNEEITAEATRTARLELDSGRLPAAPQIAAPATPTPATVNALDGKTRYLSLSEAFALGLEQGYTGFDSSSSPGFASRDLVSLSGASASGSDSVRVLALEPALAGAEIDRNLSRFDPQLFSRGEWRGLEEPPQGFSSTSNGSEGRGSVGLAKPLSSGGVTGVTWINDYFWNNSAPSNSSSFFNPTYLSRLQFGFEQPLLRERGVGINQILDRFPSSVLFPALSGRFGAGQGILVARLRFDQQKAEYERRIAHLLLNIETAYWSLYAAYIDLYSTEQALRLATEVWRVAKEQFPEKIDEGDFAGSRAQLQSFRGNRVQAIGRVLETERNLRLLLGMPVADGHRLVPVDTPTTTAYAPDWKASLEDAFTRRPELTIARQEVQRRQLNLLNQVNKLQPDLRFLATYTLLGVGSRLDGSGVVADPNTAAPQPNSALRSMTSTDYHDWTVGLQFTMPLGFRAEHALIRQARLELVQSQNVVMEQEIKLQSYLAQQYSRLFELAEVVETRRQERKALADQIEVRFKKFAAGKIPIDFLQSSVRNWSGALSAEYRAIVDYNSALAAFQFAKGTMLDYAQVQLLEGPAPAMQPVRAVEHEQRRTAMLARKAAAQPVEQRRLADHGPAYPELPDRAAALPALQVEYRPESPAGQPTALGLPMQLTAAEVQSLMLPPAMPADISLTPALPGPAVISVTETIIEVEPPAESMPPVVPARLGTPGG